MLMVIQDSQEVELAKYECELAEVTFLISAGLKAGAAFVYKDERTTIADTYVGIEDGGDIAVFVMLAIEAVGEDDDDDTESES